MSDYSVESVLFSEGTMNADDLIRLLRLQPHPKEEGYFVETYRSAEIFPGYGLPQRYSGDRCAGTAIYFLLKDPGFSEMHRLQSDEIFHFYAGATAEILLLHSQGAGAIHRIGTDFASGERPQLVVPRGTWQGMRTLGDWTLLGTTVSPGFEYRDYESGDRAELSEQFPSFAEKIKSLTRS